MRQYKIGKLCSEIFQVVVRAAPNLKELYHVPCLRNRLPYGSWRRSTTEPTFLLTSFFSDLSPSKTGFYGGFRYSRFLVEYESSSSFA